MARSNVYAREGPVGEGPLHVRRTCLFNFVEIWFVLVYNPPPANRGVESTNQDSLSSCTDWGAVTFLDKQDKSVICYVGESVIYYVIVIDFRICWGQYYPSTKYMQKLSERLCRLGFFQFSNSKWHRAKKYIENM